MQQQEQRTLTEQSRKKHFLAAAFDTRSNSNSRHMAPIPAQFSGVPNYEGYCLGPNARLEGALLSDADLRWVNLRKANLRNAGLINAKLWGACLINTDLRGANLRNADLTGADLVGANLEDAEVTGASFLGARYSRKTTRFPKGFGTPESRGLVDVETAPEARLLH